MVEEQMVRAINIFYEYQRGPSLISIDIVLRLTGVGLRLILERE